MLLHSLCCFIPLDSNNRCGYKIAAIWHVAFLYLSPAYLFLLLSLILSFFLQLSITQPVLGNPIPHFLAACAAVHHALFSICHPPWRPGGSSRGHPCGDSGGSQWVALGSLAAAPLGKYMRRERGRIPWGRTTGVQNCRHEELRAFRLYCGLLLQSLILFSFKRPWPPRSGAPLKALSVGARSALRSLPIYLTHLHPHLSSSFWTAGARLRASREGMVHQPNLRRAPRSVFRRVAASPQRDSDHGVQPRRPQGAGRGQ